MATRNNNLTRVVSSQPVSRVAPQVTSNRAGTARINQNNGAILVQEWLDLFGVTGTGQVIMPARDWLNGMDLSSYAVLVDITSLTACTLSLETAATVEGPWYTSEAFTGSGLQEVLLSSEGGGGELVNYVRWSLEPGGSDWNVCFRIKAIPQKTMRVGVNTGLMR